MPYTLYAKQLMGHLVYHTEPKKWCKNTRKKSSEQRYRETINHTVY